MKPYFFLHTFCWPSARIEKTANDKNSFSWFSRFLTSWARNLSEAAKPNSRRKYGKWNNKEQFCIKKFFSPHILLTFSSNIKGDRIARTTSVGFWCLWWIEPEIFHKPQNPTQKKFKEKISKNIQNAFDIDRIMKELWWNQVQLSSSSIHIIENQKHAEFWTEFYFRMKK